MEHKPIANLAKTLWQQGGLSRVAAVVVVLLGALAISLFRYGISHSAQLAREAGVTCGMSHDEEPQRAQALVQQLGLDVTETTWNGNPAWLADDVTVALLSMRSPCDTALVLRATIVDRWPDNASVQPENFETYDVRRSFDVGGATLVPNGVGKPVELVRSRPLATTQPSTLRFDIIELHELAAIWRTQWFERALRIAEGREQPPRQMLFRPGKDPQTRLRQVEAFVRDHGAGSTGVVSPPDAPTASSLSPHGRP